MKYRINYKFIEDLIAEDDTLHEVFFKTKYGWESAYRRDHGFTTQYMDYKEVDVKFDDPIKAKFIYTEKAILDVSAVVE